MAAGKNISAVTALEIPSLVPNESKLLLVGSLGIIRSVMGDKNKIMGQYTKRNYEIPDPSIKFYATGLYGLEKKETEFLKSILEPVKKYFDCSLSKYPSHISCRYLGYKDEVSFKQINRIVPILKEIYGKFLPLECITDNLFASWESNPSYKPRLLMLKVRSPKLKLLHKEILKKTKEFQIFSKMENGNFNPHFTIGKLKKEFEDKIPKYVFNFIRNTKIRPFKIYLRVAYIHTEKRMRPQEIIRT